ncbi:MAG: serine hydrolase domain-containing protein, partial [Rhodanobacter sp.]
MFTRLMPIAAFVVLMAGASAFAASAGQAAPAPSALTVSTTPASAAGTSQAAIAQVQGATPSLTAQDAQQFFDSLVPYTMHRGDIAGGVIVVVKDGQVLFAKGYGYADVATRKPVIADQTLFRVGSVSKTFTWTSVMQLVGQGKIDLNVDVNQYLDFKIPPKFGKPITMLALLTMTPGFEDTARDELLSHPKQLFPLAEYVKNHVPARIFPPGEIGAYSNYGAALAGYIVQRVSGEPFDNYVENHIFKPLGMSHSTFAQPLPAALAPDLSLGYHSASDPATVPFEAVEVSPAGAMTSSGTDMARFMMAHLDNGQYDGASTLSPAMIALMHKTHTRMAPGLNGHALGFAQEDRNGLHIIGHGGDTHVFHSDMELLLDKHVGLFMAFNSMGKEGAAGSVRSALFHAFLDRYYPYTPPVQDTVAHPEVDAARVAGWYISSRRVESGLRLIFALTQTQVTANPDGTIQFALITDLSGTPRIWRETGPLTYREVGGQAETKFVADKQGRIRYWAASADAVYQPVHGLRSMGMLKLLGTLSILILLGTLAIWIGGAIVRRRMRAPLFLVRSQRWWRLGSRAGAVALLLLLIGWLWLAVYISGGTSFALDGEMTVLYVLGVLATIGALAIVVEAALRVARGPGGWLVRVGELVLGLVGLYALWAILAFGLITFSYTY